MRKFLAIAVSLLASLSFAAFDESHFNYGRQWSNSFNENTDFSGKGLSHLAIWVGDNDNYNTYWEGSMVRACKKNNLTPVFYAYVIAEYDKDQGYSDCDMGSPNHCTNGAQTIRDHWSSILARYKSYAQGVAQDFGTSGTTIWLIEPDFFQYSTSGDANSSYNQVGGGIPDADLCGTYFNQIVAAIKQYLPNAKIAVDISPWMNDFITTWYSNFDRSKVDYLFSSGGRTQGNQSRIRSDNNNNVTWAQASAAMGGKKIIADDGYGVGGGSNNDYQDWMNVSNLNNRISDGVIGITIQEPNDSYYSFAASNPISINGGNSSNSANSSSSAAQSSSSRPSSSSVAPTPSNLTALIDNFEDGDEFSEWGGEWTTYTDAGDGGQSTVTTSYSTGYNSSKALKASYTLRKGSLNYDPQVGISVDLLADKSSVNLNSCTSISYYYKGTAHAVRMESPLVMDYAYHQANVEAANNWTKKTVTLTSMTQPDWTSNNVNVSSARQSVKAFSWQVSGANGTTGSLEIDNVRCEGLPEAASSSSVSSSSVRSSSSVSSSSVASSSSVSSSSVSSSSVSSSSFSSSSNSTSGPCIAFENGTGDYGDHCYNSGLGDMEPGKCYTMNPARAPAPQWINASVTETYWWVETSCGEEESSSSAEESSGSAEVSSSSAIPTYTITFKNGNATLLTVVLEEGSTPTYTGEIPTKTATPQYSYTFSGWDPALATVTGNVVYTAKFDQVVNYYAIQFFNGTVLLSSESVAYGEVPVYSGATPTKEPDAGYTYAFDGWTPDLAPVTQAADYTAKFVGTKKKFTVAFVDDDGTTVLKEAVQYDFGTLANDIVKPANPTKATNVEFTYEFAGWSPEIVDVVDNATYMATYTSIPRKYTITFVDDDGTTVLLPAAEYNYGTIAANIAKPADPTKDATAEFTYTFAGWSPTIARVTGDAVYTATYTSTKNKYTITFVNGDGSETSSQVEYGETPVAPAGKTPANDAQYTYSFVGWDAEIVAVTGNATYTAVVNSTVNKYSVTFVDEDGTTVLLAAAEYDYGTLPANIAKPADPTKQGTAGETFAFAGWTPAIATVTANAVYTATYTSSTNTYTVTFKDDDGTVLSTATYPYGTAAASIALPATPTKDATAEFTYEFSGWTPAVAAVSGNATYTATYAATKRSYTITFVNGDGSETSSQVEYGTVPTAPAGKTPANDAQYTYSFVGWDAEIVSVTGNATYTAVVNSTVNKYSVTFVDEDGTTVLLAAAEYDYGTLPANIAKPADPTKQGTAGETFAFAGWTPAIATVTANAVYTATYTSSTNTYTVTFKDDDGTVLSTATYPYGTAAASIALPATPTKDATAEFTYEFSGWTPAVAAVSGNATYTATYDATKRSYTITFVNGDGSETSSQVEYGTVPTAPAGKTPANDAQYSYSFVGWNAEIVAVTGNATYTAVVNRTVNEYTVTFEDEDGTALYSATYPYGTAAADVIKPRTPEKPATVGYTYEFSGWNPKVAEVTGDATYTATFNATVNMYTVTFLNYDNSELQSSKVAYGEMPEYVGETPVKPSTTTYNYSFDYWSPDIESVTGEASYKAVFREEAIVIPSSSSAEESSSSEEESSSSEVVVESSSSEEESSSSEVVVESSSSEEESSSSEVVVESSSSEEGSSSSEVVVESSSSEEESSSSEEVVESSSSEEQSSSSEEIVESSSSEEESSSSQESTCIAFVNGAGGYAEHCYNSGLNNMEAEICYTMAPTRSGSLLWMNADASNREWWVETSCFEFVPPSSSSAATVVSSSSSAAGPEVLVAGAPSQLKVSFAHNGFEVYVPSETLVRVQVFDMLGHSIQSFSDRVVGSHSIDLDHLPQGTYLVRVTSGSAVKTARITIK